MKIEDLAVFKLGNGNRIAFRLDPWVDQTSLSSRFPRLFRIAINPKGSILEHWDSSFSSWNVVFGRPLKEEEITSPWNSC